MAQPTGPLLPSAEAIDIMNENAAAVAKRARFATLAANQQRVGRDALRRDFAPRAPTAMNLPGARPVPQDQTPSQPGLPTDLLHDLISQFQGTGGTGGSGGGGGGGGHTTVNHNGSGGGDPPSGGGGGGSPGTGVQTFHGDPGATFIGQAGGPASQGFQPSPGNGHVYNTSPHTVNGWTYIKVGESWWMKRTA